MTTISSSSINTPISQSNSAAIEPTAVNNESIESETESTTASSGNSVNLSTRAQKIQQLQEEFFPTGPQSLQITPEFLTRLNEYGFINDDEVKSLSPSVDTGTQQSASTVKELSTFLDSFIEKITKDEPGNTLVSTLEKAKDILNNIDGSNPTALANDIKSVSAALSQFDYSAYSEAMTDEDFDHLINVQLALKIADKLNPENLSSSNINQYLSVLNQSS